MVEIIKWCGWLLALGTMLLHFCTTNPLPQPEKEDLNDKTEQTIP